MSSLAREAMLQPLAATSHIHASIHFPEGPPITSTPSSSVPSTGTSNFPVCDRRMISGGHDPTRCWACEDEVWLPDRCHVIGLSDRMVQIYQQANLIPSDYEINDKSNGVLLCKRCHSMFDDFACPNFMFFPTDIQYFIDFEIEDRARRQNAVPPTPRRLPTAAEYCQHQKEQDLIPNDGTSGLYRRVWFKPPPQYGTRPGAVGAKTWKVDPKTWHGQPANTLRHMFHLMGCPQFWRLPFKMRNEIGTLWNLYFHEDPQNYQEGMFVDVPARPHGSEIHTESGHPGNDGSEPSNKDNFPSLPSGKRVRSRSQSRNEHDEDNQHAESPPKRQKLSYEFLSQSDCTPNSILPPLNPYQRIQEWLLES